MRRIAFCRALDCGARAAQGIVEGAQGEGSVRPGYPNPRRRQPGWIEVQACPVNFVDATEPRQRESLDGLSPVFNPCPVQLLASPGHVGQHMDGACIVEQLRQVQPDAQVPHYAPERVLLVDDLSLQRRPGFAVPSETEQANPLESRVLHWRYTQLRGDQGGSVSMGDRLGQI